MTTVRRVDAPWTPSPNGPRKEECACSSSEQASGDKSVLDAAQERADVAAREAHRAGPPACAMTRDRLAADARAAAPAFDGMSVLERAHAKAEAERIEAAKPGPPACAMTRR